jgi:peroxin-2
MTSATPSQQEWRQQLAHAQQDLRRLSASSGSSITATSTSLSVMRSSQADASRLDDELTLLLREQFMRIFSLLHPGTIGRLQPELTVLLDFLIFRYSVWEGRPLPGMALMNLRFRNEGGLATGGNSSIPIDNSSDTTSSPRLAAVGGHSGVEGPGLSTTQRNLYCFGAVFLRYIWSRTGHAAATSHWGDAEPNNWRNIAWHVLRRTEATYRAASVLNFLAFLRSGRYRSILERILRTRLVYAQPSAPRAISYEYLNRQLVWAEVSEVLLFILPLVNAAAVKRAVRSILPRLPTFPFTPISQTIGSNGMSTIRGGDGSIGSSGGTICGICGSVDILTPCKAEPCGHIFCYYCLRGHTAVDSRFQCPECLVKVEGMRPAYPRLGQN